MTIRTVAVLLCLFAVFANAADTGTLTRAAVAVQADIEESVAELNRLRESVARERTPLARRLATLEGQVGQLRGRTDRMRSLRHQGQAEFEALKHETDILDEECRFVYALLSEYRRSLETRVAAAESLHLQPRLAKIDSVMGEDTLVQNLPELTQHLLGLAATWNGEKLWGMSFAGTAVGVDGIEHLGRFAVLGPITYFSDDPKGLSAIALARMDSAIPAVFPDFDEKAKQAVHALVSGGEAVVPVDVSAGDALAVAAAKPSLIEHARKGGFVMVPLVLIGVLAVLLVFWKVLQLGRIRVGPDVPIGNIVARARQNDDEGARAAAGELGEPLSSLMLTAIAHKKAAKEHIEEILHEHILTYVPRLERHLGTLAVFGGVAPLLGLLGTVTGMIHTFQLVTVFGTGDAKLLSGGISEALVTTEFGLIIAIPVLLIHAFLSRRVRVIIAALEGAAVRFVSELKLGEAPE